MRTTKRGNEKFDIFKHHTGTKVYNCLTKKTGVVVDIKETFVDCIEPFVDYGDGKLIREITWRLEVIDDEKNVDQD